MSSISKTNTKIISKANSNVFKCNLCPGHRFYCGDCRYYYCSHSSCPIYSNNQIKIHLYCVDCKKNFVCNQIETCNDCYKNYNYITDNVAVGNAETKWDQFDIVVNLNYPYNGAKLNQYLIHFTIDNKLIINLGIQDSTEKNEFVSKSMGQVIRLLTNNTNKLNELNEEIQSIVLNPNSKILFQCWAGISRSSTFAIKYLSKKHEISINQAYNLVKSKRKFIKPNEYFMKLLQESELEKQIVT